VLDPAAEEDGRLPADPPGVELPGGTLLLVDGEVQAVDKRQHAAAAAIMDNRFISIPPVLF